MVERLTVCCFVTTEQQSHSQLSCNVQYQGDLRTYISEFTQCQCGLTEHAAVTLRLLPHSIASICPSPAPACGHQLLDHRVTHSTRTGDGGYTAYWSHRPRHRTEVTTGCVLLCRTATFMDKNVVVEEMKGEGIP